MLFGRLERSLSKQRKVWAPMDPYVLKLLPHLKLSLLTLETAGHAGQEQKRASKGLSKHLLGNRKGPGHLGDA